MIEILMYLNKYVPKKRQIDDEGEIEEEIIKSISFGGDQLTEERAISAQKAMKNGDTNLEKLLGLDPKFEDWHAKVCLYEVSFRQCLLNI